VSEAAFPTPVSMNGHNKHHSNHKGMTLRDYFAASFVKSGTVFPREFPINTPERVARQAYELADAMLKERDGNS
jgi:hypothetical protein